MKVKTCIIGTLWKCPSQGKLRHFLQLLHMLSCIHIHGNGRKLLSISKNRTHSLESIRTQSTCCIQQGFSGLGWNITGIISPTNRLAIADIERKIAIEMMLANDLTAKSDRRLRLLFATALKTRRGKQENILMRHWRGNQDKRRMKWAETAVKKWHIQGISDGLKSRRKIRKVRAGISFSEICSG